jgi:4-hydroxy 2-oxovalerate aldolase
MKPAHIVEILDCTIRDGSYVINGAWTKDDVKNIVRELSLCGFGYIEVGNGIGLGAHRRKVPSICTDAEYVSAAVEQKGAAKIGVFFIPGIGDLKDIEQFRAQGGDFIRVGTNVSDSDTSEAYIRFAKKIGLEVGYNFMKSYTVTPYELCVRASRIEKFGADCISLVDSAGGMLPREVAHYISRMKECLSTKVGFHGHNNLLMANANSLAAVENGADVVDTTLMGMGRGAGNSQSETMLVLLNKCGFPIKIDALKVSKISEKYILPKTSKLKGSDGLELVLGYALFHDSYLQLIETYSAKYKVDYQELIMEVSRINKENPSEDLIENVARQLGKREKVRVFFPKFYHKEIR